VLIRMHGIVASAGLLLEKRGVGKCDSTEYMFTVDLDEVTWRICKAVS
jgi:hypothetical protein